ncbi:hypothetical protein N0V82_003754 [Gnomoniopsis sp. IMI 355080]|nr:hypothetical protein N0V82_003754 [Gnomoniopsis sp. IMI 355080]
MEEHGQVVTSDDLHAAFSDRSRRELQKKIEQLKRALTQENEKLAALAKIEQAQVAAIGTVQHLDAVSKAYTEVATSAPLLPFPDSVVPALIALRTTNTTINESRRFLASQKVSLQDAQDRLNAEKASLADQKALTKALESRLQSLRSGIETRTAMSPGQVARERLSELRQQIRETDKDTTSLQTTLKKFIELSLSTMLAAEQIGGPVAGEVMDVDSDTLEAGFSATGKRKKFKADASTDKRQRRIDDMFSGGRDEDEPAESDKRAAARDEMQELVAELTHKLMAAGGSNTDAYINIPEESASVRFLTRVKVAEFHPRDSGRIRLVDFGREIGE